MTLEGLGEVFKGDSADTCAGKFPLVSMGGQQRVSRAQTRERGPLSALVEIYLSVLGKDVLPKKHYHNCVMMVCDETVTPSCYPRIMSINYAGTSLQYRGHATLRSANIDTSWTFFRSCLQHHLLPPSPNFWRLEVLIQEEMLSSPQIKSNWEVSEGTILFFWLLRDACKIQDHRTSRSGRKGP